MESLYSTGFEGSDSWFPKEKKWFLGIFSYTEAYR